MAISESAQGHRVALSRGLAPAAVVGGLSALAAALHFVTPFNHDEAFFIEVAGRLLDGGHFGTDIVDINPPHVWLISAVPVWLARQIGLRIDIAATLFTALMAAWSLVMVDRLLEARAWRRALVVLAAILVLFVPGYDFGQREHWMVLLALPYIVACGLRAEGATVSVAFGVVIGAAACFGFCMKPYYLLVPVALELWLLARTRRLSSLITAETVALGGAGLCYLALTLVYERAYFERELPDALLGYWAYKASLGEVLSTAVMLVAPPVLLALLCYSTRNRGERTPALAQAFAVAGTTFLAAAMIQMKPWPYHFVPSVVFFDLAVAVMLIAETGRAGTQKTRMGAFAVLIAIGLAPSAAEAVRSIKGSDTASRVEELAAVFRANPGPNRSVFGFITSPRDVFPAVIASGMQWAAPFCCDYLIAAAARADEAPVVKRAAIMAAAVEQAETAIAAVRAKEPGVIVIDYGEHRLGFNDRRFDYVEWLEGHTSFAGILARYREAGRIGPFRVFVRK